MKTIKVCHLSTVHSKKDIRVFFKECRTLAANGYEVSYITQGKHDEVIDDVKLQGTGKPIIKNRILRMTVGCRRMVKIALKEDADIYHIHDSELLRFIKVLKKGGKKVVYDSHEHLPMQIMEKEWLPSGLRKIISKIAGGFEMSRVRYMDLIFVVADKTYERFVNHGVDIVKLENFPIFGEFKDIKVNYEIKKDLRKICYTGAVWIERGLDTMCMAAGLTDCTFVIAGRIDHSEPDKFIAEFGNNIIFPGYLSREGVVKLYEESIAGVCLFKPYPNNMIDPPTKIFEYMAAGIPVIASDFESITKVIGRYKCGICINPLDVGKIQKAMQYVIDNPEIAEMMGKNGRNAIGTELNWEIHSKVLIDAYEKLLENRNG